MKNKKRKNLNKVKPEFEGISKFVIKTIFWNETLSLWSKWWGLMTNTSDINNEDKNIK